MNQPMQYTFAHSKAQASSKTRFAWKIILDTSDQYFRLLLNLQ